MSYADKKNLCQKDNWADPRMKAWLNIERMGGIGDYKTWYTSRPF